MFTKQYSKTFTNKLKSMIQKSIIPSHALLKHIPYIFNISQGPFGTPDSIRPERIMVDSIRLDCIRPDKNLILCSVWYVTV